MIKKEHYIYLYDIVLLMFFIWRASLLINNYPIPHLTWDSFYYIKTSITDEYGIRPSGYANFLRFIYSISEDIRTVVRAQFTLHFLSVLFLLNALRKIFNLNGILYLLLGILFLAEPVALYHCDSVLSDLLFSVLTLSAIASLLLYVYNGKYFFLVLHIVLIFCCIEVRHIGLFYPFFTCGILLLFTKRSKLLFFNIALIFAVYFGLYKWHVNENKKHYSVSVYSAFSGWTHANNAMYALPLIKLDPATISNPDIRKMHEFVSQYMDTSSFKVDYTQPGSGFLWEDKSPLNVLRLNLIDSLKVDYNTSWYLSAPYYHYYGTYLERHFPLAYLKAYMVPNLKSLLAPQLGEMSDYYLMPFSDPVSLDHYHLKESDLKCKEQIYKDVINAKIQSWYSVLIKIFALSVLFFLVFLRRFDSIVRKGLAIVITYVLLLYAFTLYSSWFMFRYLLPVYPLMLASCVAIIYTVVKSFIKGNNKKETIAMP